MSNSVQENELRLGYIWAKCTSLCPVLFLMVESLYLTRDIRFKIKFTKKFAWKQIKFTFFLLLRMQHR